MIQFNSAEIYLLFFYASSFFSKLGTYITHDAT